MDMFTTSDELHIAVTNLKDFNTLISDIEKKYDEAEKVLQELNQLILNLKYFRLTFKFNTDERECK